MKRIVVHLTSFPSYVQRRSWNGLVVFCSLVFVLQMEFMHGSSIMTPSYCPPGKYRKHVYYEPTKLCYPAGLQGPCGKLMAIYPKSNDSPEGACYCRHNEDAQEGEDCIGRPLLFWPPENRCYFSYSRGPCKREEWLTPNKNKNNEATCQQNPCASAQMAPRAEARQRHANRPDLRFWFDFDGQCFQTKTEASCGNGNTAFFNWEDMNPHCGPTKSLDDCDYSPQRPIPGRKPCQQGQVRLSSTKCGPAHLARNHAGHPSNSNLQNQHPPANSNPSVHNRPASPSHASSPTGHSGQPSQPTGTAPSSGHQQPPSSPAVGQQQSPSVPQPQMQMPSVNIQQNGPNGPQSLQIGG